LRVTGVFRADNAEGFVDLLERTLGVTAERTAGAIVLRAAPPKK
jgi:ferric-dicitrate binding protein FerR (iron transport regulator)